MVTNRPLMLYKLDLVPGKYVFCANDRINKNETAFQVVVGDSFRVQPEGGKCLVIISNAYVLDTKCDNSTVNKATQYKMWLDVYIRPFPSHTEIVFDDSVVDLLSLKVASPGSTPLPGGQIENKHI